MKLRTRFAFLVSLFLVTFFIYFLASKPKLNGDYTSFGVAIPTSYPILGIDVSHYQGDIDWRLVKETKHGADSIQFAFIKATEGLTLIDDQVETNANAAHEVGLDFGFYHFFIAKNSAREQAKFFCNQITEFPSTLKPVLDLEFDGDFSNGQLHDSISVFLNFVEKKIGDRPIIYTYSNFFKEHELSSFESELFWIAQYGVHCDLMKNENVKAWQFTEKGTVNGIAGLVDLNLAKNQFFDSLKKK
jgi:lysozyme